MTRLITSSLILVALTGCFWKPTKLVVYPDAPAVIMDTRRGYVRLGLWSEERKALVDYGWVKASDYHGWTLTKFDWEKYREERRRADDGQPDR